jgi:HAD superfamily hydrolase (TIGR01509 family)
MIKVVIFDIDGTLVDSVDLHAIAWQETFRHFGKEIPFCNVRAQIGKGSDQLLPVFFAKEEIQSFGKDMEEYRRSLFQHNYLPQVQAFPQVRELFQYILADKKKIVLATSSPQEDVVTYKRIARIEDLIEEETSSDDAERSKPEPDIFAAALKKANSPLPSEVIVVGDSPYDAEAASKLNISTIGLLCGGFPAAELRAAGCLSLYRDPADLLAQYEQSPLK